MMYKVDPTPSSSSSSPSSSPSSNGKANGTSNTVFKVKGNTNGGNVVTSSLRWMLLDFPLWIILLTWMCTHLFHDIYTGPIQLYIESFRRSGEVDDDGYYPDFFDDLTYYGRQCDAEDISTGNSNDLIVPSTATSDEASDIMMKHGAVLIQNLLSNSTATKLRDYLEYRHDIKDQLPWHELFFTSIGRLSLGLGVDDHPIIAQALKEVGSNEVLRTTLEGIVGPDPALVEFSTLTTLHGAQVQGTNDMKDR